MALDIRVEVTITGSDALAVTSEGEGSELPTSGDHLAARVARMVLGHDRVAIHICSEIPVSRGLGSSAALAVAAAAAAGVENPLGLAARFDGHPENAAASVLGGLIAAADLGDGPVAMRLPLDPDLQFVVVIPQREMSTRQAREALPPTVPHRDATHNLGRLGLLIAGLADRHRLQPRLFDDRLHQPYRAALFPESARLIEGLVEAGALGACWSGAGPTVLAVCDPADSTGVLQAGADLLRELGVEGDARLLGADMRGLCLEDNLQA